MKSFYEYLIKREDGRIGKKTNTNFRKNASNEGERRKDDMYVWD